MNLQKPNFINPKIEHDQLNSAIFSDDLGKGSSIFLTLQPQVIVFKNQAHIIGSNNTGCSKKKGEK